MRVIITNFNDLAQVLSHTVASKKQLIVETMSFENEENGIESIFIGDTPEGGTINIKKTASYYERFEMEINHNYTGEFNFEDMTLKEVVYLLTRENIL